MPDEVDVSAPAEPPFVGKLCEICKKPEPFAATTAVLAWQDDASQHFAHEACFYRAQSEQAQQQAQQAQQLLAAAVAAWGGTLNLSMAHLRRAAERGFVVRTEPRPGGLRLREGDKVPPPAQPAPPASEQLGVEQAPAT